MCDFRIIRHDDYHGDAILFSVVDEDGREHNRCVSEAEAIGVGGVPRSLGRKRRAQSAPRVGGCSARRDDTRADEN